MYEQIIFKKLQPMESEVLILMYKILEGNQFYGNFHDSEKKIHMLQVYNVGPIITEKKLRWVKNSIDCTDERFRQE